jgi:tetratricopeptide (TPR) repeat protein
MQHLSEAPYDAEARYALAVAYQKGGHLNEAIIEYQKALALSNGNADVSQKCVAGLQQLHVIANPDEQLEFHKLELTAHGQGFNQGDVASANSRRALLAGQPEQPVAAQGTIANSNSPAMNFAPPGNYGNPNGAPIQISAGANALDPGF